MNNVYKCQVPRCRNESFLLYEGIGVCDSCWEKHCDKEINLLERLKLKTKKELKKELKKEVEPVKQPEIKKEKEPEVIKIWKEKQQSLLL